LCEGQLLLDARELRVGALDPVAEEQLGRLHPISPVPVESLEEFGVKVDSGVLVPEGVPPFSI
jgi:hypothetical protein